MVQLPFDVYAGTTTRLMKCKANKNRPLHFAKENTDVDLTFVFDKRGVRICSPDSKLSVELMCGLDVDIEILNRTLIARVNITTKQFNALRDLNDREKLVSICREGSTSSQLKISKSLIIAVVTQTGKYGLMRVIEVTPEMVCFEACHILL